MTLDKDTLVPEAEHTDLNDPYKTGSGSAESPGGGSAAVIDTNVLTAGQESYPGDRPAGESNESGLKKA